MNKICILDYGIGNVRSIANALEKVGATPLLTHEESEIMSGEALILPGVGAFAKGMQNLEERNLVPLIHKFIETGKPFMGICLGMQMMLEESEEFGSYKGLGLIPGKVKKLEVTGQKLPHVSWNEIKEPKSGRWEGTPLQGNDSSVYFVHTYAANPEMEEHVLALTEYDNEFFCSAVRKENVFGFQFHPEKSGDTGLRILENFKNYGS